MLEIVGSLVVCVLVADLLSGHGHWLEDTYCTDGMPWVGKTICDPNIEHHVSPMEMVHGGTFFSRNIVVWVICGVAGFLMYMVGLGYWQVYMALAVTSFSNEVHRWNHMGTKQLDPVGRYFRDSGLIQSRSQHSLHHAAPYTGYYCVLLDFNNAWMERLNYWRTLEWCVEKIFRIRPKREDRSDSVD